MRGILASGIWRKASAIKKVNKVIRADWFTAIEKME